MITVQASEIEKVIIDYIELQNNFLLFHKKKNDAEKEYNKLLANSGGEMKNFTLGEADMIYKAYLEMLVNEEQSRIARDRFNEAEEKLKEIGRILFQATITAEITIPSINGGLYRSKQVTVKYNNGEVLVI